MSDGTEIEQLDAAPPISAELRAKILSDPNIPKIAAELEMDLDAFVNQIGYYLNNPGIEPACAVVSDANPRKMGVERADQTARAAGPRRDGSNDTRAPRGRPDRCCRRRPASIAEQRLDRRFAVEPPQVPNGAARR